MSAVLELERVAEPSAWMRTIPGRAELELIAARAERDRVLDRYVQATAAGARTAADAALRLLAELTARVDECTVELAAAGGRTAA